MEGSIGINAPSMNEEIIIPDISMAVESSPDIDLGLSGGLVSFMILLLSHAHSYSYILL
jgi:hypothetical protein